MSNLKNESPKRRLIPIRIEHDFAQQGISTFASI